MALSGFLKKSHLISLRRSHQPIFRAKNRSINGDSAERFECVSIKWLSLRAFNRGNNFYDFPACYYRFHLEAPVRFSSSIRCGIEHGGVNDTDSTYASLAYYYIRDRVGRVETDSAAFTGPGVEVLENFF
jgi:hypothetical protein